MNRFKALLSIGAILGGITSAQAQTTRALPAGKLPAARTQAEKELSIRRAATPQNIFTKKADALPAGIRYPGEFEESQSVLISWSYDYDNSGNPTGADVTSEYGLVSARLAAAIQKEVPVVIRITKAADSTAIKTFMQNNGTPLVNYRFMIAPGEDWWTRDFGPNGVYYGTGDSLAFIDLKYYDGRDRDNDFPITMASEMGIPNFKSRLNGEGGNLMADGFGSVFFSDVFTSVNTDAMVVNPAFSSKEVLDTITALFGAKQNIQLKTLLCDGGTGHIDLYIKMIDEQTIMASKYPDVITAGDKKIIEDNLQLLASFKSTYNRPFRVYRIPHPTDDAGTYSRKTCSQINADARTFVNGITVNKTFIYPSYSDETSGNKTQTAEVTNLFKQIMPGYKVVDIDSRVISPLGGEIHCITMQIPADNPVLFWHPSVDGYQTNFANQFHIVARVTNRSGIAQATCFWRIKGSANFSSFNLTDSSGYFIGDIVANGLTANDELEYYLSATTNNGKTVTKPITAPDGYYSIFFTPRTAIAEYEVTTKDYLFNAYPNPAANAVTIPFYVLNEGGVEIAVTDVTGKVVKRISKPSVQNGLNEATINLEDLNNGVYFYTYRLNNQIVGTRKFVVSK